jgi:isopentenyldiphosphate isomerase
MREEIGLRTPLRFVGRTQMNDEGATKFIYVYVTTAETAQVVDSEQVEALAYWSLPALEQQIDARPEEFSPTLRHVLDVAEPDLSARI